VLRARAASGETTLSYASLTDLVGPVFDEVRGALPDVQEHALGAALLRADSADAVDPRTTGTALVTALTTLALPGPLLIAIDDVQWLDAASKRCLEFALRRLPTGIGVLVVRRGVAGAVPLALGDAQIEHIELGPLSLAAVHHLVSTRLGTSLARPALVALESVSGGNPFWALELARSLEPGWRPALGGDFPLPRDLRRLLADRLDRLASPTRDALLTAAALSRPTTALVEPAIEDAKDAGIVRIEAGAIEFTHPLLRSAAYASAPEAQRRRLHKRLAQEVEDVEERARHLALAHSRPDEQVASALDAGAARAYARGAPDAAGELYERAARLTPDGRPEDVARRLVLAGERMFHAGDTDHARKLLEEALTYAPAGPARGGGLRLLGEMRSTEDSFPEAIRLLEDALGHVDTPEARIPVLLDLAFAYVSVGEIALAAERTHTARGEAEVLGPGPLLGEALATGEMVAFLAGGAARREELERAVALEDRTRRLRIMMRPSAIAAMLAVYEGRMDEGIAGVRELAEWALERGEESELPFLLVHIAWAEWWRGRHEAAAVVAEESLRIAALTGSVTMRGVALVHRARAATCRGDVEAARADLDESAAIMNDAGWMFGISWVLTARGFLELSLGDAAAAERAFGPLGEGLAAAGIVEPTFRLFVPDEVEALVALGEIDRAAALTEEFEDSARARHREWALAASSRCRGLVAAARGDLPTARAALEEAVRQYGRLDMPFDLARTELVLGRVERRAKRKRAAREALGRAAEAFEELGIPLWAAMARADLDRITLTPPPNGQLTETERRVAELAAAGRTNREAAQLLFMSPKTVEATLARAYRKLGIRSRAELGARMARDAEI
jgi:DNA-binding NarL/FixJ family response regulator